MSHMVPQAGCSALTLTENVHETRHDFFIFSPKKLKILFYFSKSETKKDDTTFLPAHLDFPKCIEFSVLFISSTCEFHTTLTCFVLHNRLPQCSYHPFNDAFNTFHTLNCGCDVYLPMFLIFF